MKMIVRRFAATAAATLVLAAMAAFSQESGENVAKPDGERAGKTKPVKVFILAGQSNMVGHSRGHTMGTLFNTDGPKDQKLIDLVFGKDSKLSKERLNELNMLARQLNELTGGIGDPKIKAIMDATKKAAVEAEAERMKAILEAYKKEVVAASSISDRVYITSIADNNKKSGKLSVGYGGDPSKIGPEYGFGLSIARVIDGPILLIKASWGGKSLNYDFRPPSAGPYALNDKEKEKNNSDEIQRKAGQSYRDMNKAVHEILDNMKENHPAYEPAVGYDLAGFVWFQGFNDQFDPAFKANYKDNMIAFIGDVRREHNVPKMPFVIGVLGTGQTKENVDGNAVSVAQREAAAFPEFKGNVVAVESYTEYAMDSLAVFNAGWQKNYYEWDLVGSDRPYHYLGSGKFFVRVGDAFASAMAEMIPRR
jgi:alpha-galactosidase